jgi:alpha-glucuronidase
MKTEGQKAFERYMTGLASTGIKFGTMPTYDSLNKNAQAGWDAVADSTTKIHPDYEPVVVQPPVEPDPVEEPAV